MKIQDFGNVRTSAPYLMIHPKTEARSCGSVSVSDTPENIRQLFSDVGIHARVQQCVFLNRQFFEFTVKTN